MKKRWSTAKIMIVYLISLIVVLLLITGGFLLMLRKGGAKLNKPAAAGNRILRAAIGDETGRGRRGDDDGKDRGRRAEAEPDEEPEKPEEDEEVRLIGAQDRIVRDQLVTPVGNGEDTVTVMILLNGSNLESESGFATDDIGEMLKADLSDKVNVVIQTVGTRRWHNYDIASDHSQRWHIENHKLTLVDNSLKQLDCTAPETLRDFVTWSAEKYPADRYFLILWDHGGGSVDGYGYDEWQGYYDSLTMDEMYSALSEAGIPFDFIGMDACIMSSIEICYALYPFCDYCILSEDFESAIGWSYTGWLTALSKNTSIDTVSLATILIDDMVKANEEDGYGSSSTLALIDERYIPSAFNSWMNFAFANEEALLAVNYSREVERTGRARPLPADRVSSDLIDCYITDALALVVSVDSPYSKPLVAKLARAVAYYNCTDDNIGMTGLSVTLPYQDNAFYKNLGKVYSGIGIEKRYIEWLAKFQESYTPTDYYDYEDFDQQWNGWEEYSY